MVSLMWPKWRMLWMVVLMVILLEAWRSDGCLEKERIALLQLKSFFNRLHWMNGTSEDSDCCQWRGVECSNATGRVIVLHLDHTRKGDPSLLNTSLFLPFEELTNLYLGENKITDIEWPSFNLKGLSSLKILDLSSNNFKGSVDIGAFYNMTSLEELDLSFNAIESLQSSQASKLRLVNLKELDLSWNLFNNTIFTQLGGFPNLKTLSIRYNQINGSVDIKELASLRNLEDLNLSNNEMSEFVSQNSKATKLEMLNLKELHLYGNLFNNTVFTRLGGFPNLKTLDVGANKLNGLVDIKELASLRNLEKLDLSENVVSEFISQSRQDMHLLSNVEELYLDATLLNINFLQTIGVLTSLQVLSLSGCGMIGTLPDQGWCYLKNLQQLNLEMSFISGSIPSCLSNLTSLRSLRLSYNKFTGNVAHTSLTNLTWLQNLDISYNHFQVPLSFHSFANHSKLKLLFLDGNQLVTEPATTLQITTKSSQLQLKAFSAASCTIQGQTKGLPQFLYFQNDLRSLEISNTNFGGIPFPVWLIENNTRLQLLNMIDSSIMGALLLPSHPHTHLLGMLISNNNITSQIPTDICLHFPHLQMLFLSGNAIKGEIPSCFGGMNSLSILDLSFNQLFGEVPVELAISGFLNHLRLSNNNLSGKIAPEIFVSNELEGLHLDGNNFDGEVPHLPTSAQVLLGVLNLSDNHLSGKIPRWIWNMPFVEILALSNNNLEGIISEESCKLNMVRVLDLSQNNLSGSIPSCFNPPSLMHLHLGKNRLSGLMMRAFYNSSSLVTLDLGENNISGAIPYWIGSLSNLNILLLKANQLTGEIPIQLCQLKWLSIIGLSQNKLFGPIPTCLNNLTPEPSYSKPDFLFHEVGFPSLDHQIEGIDPSIYHDHLYTTSEIGQEEIEFSTKYGSYNFKGDILRYFSGIDLSCNHLTGPIPPELGNLSEILGLNLSYNNLSGPIPSTFSKLKQIESLDLSHNKLDGRIPPQLTELTTLEVFTVAHNNLSGPLPDMKAQFSTFEESSYEGNPLLCGPPLRNKCIEGDPTETSNPSSDEAEDDGYIDMGDFYISFVVSYAIMFLTIGFVLYINRYWRRSWFYFIEERSTACYYFIVDTLHNFPYRRRRNT